MQIKNMRWYLMLLAFVGILICYMDRSALAYAIEPIKSTFNLNNEQFGILSSVFGFGYLLMMFIGGVLVDKFGARGIWSIFAFIWSVATLLIGFSSGFTMLIILRLILGSAEAPSFPSLTKSATNWLTIDERNKALAIGLVAVPLSSVIGAPLCTNIIYLYGWTEMFIFLGILGIIWSILWHLLSKNKPQQSTLITQEELLYLEKSKLKDKTKNTSKESGMLFILFNKTFLLNNFTYFSFGYLLFFGITWLPGYLTQVFALNIKQVGIFLTLPWILASIAILCCGWLSDMIFLKTQSLRKSRSLIIGVSMVVSALLFLPVIFIHNLTLDIIFMSLAIACGLFPNSCFYSLNADLAPDKVATSQAVMGLFLALAGILAPLLTGYFSNLTGNFKIAIGIMMLLNISSGILVLLFQNPDKELADKLATL